MMARGTIPPRLQRLEGTMCVCRNLLGLMMASLLLSVLLVSVMFANSAETLSQAYPLRITVLSAETHAINGGTPVPKDCDLQNFSAYCNESANPTSESTMVVQNADGKYFRVSCTTDSHWSKCGPLPVGQTYDARREKHGITIVSWNAKGKEIRQFYQLAAVATPPSSASAAPHAPAPAQNSPVPAPAAPSARAQSVSAQNAITPATTQPATTQKVRCNFSSTPPGADITIDGSYVGDTPSEISLTTGKHVVVIAKIGFGEWRRELTVSPDSAVNVTANLQTQP
jgi:hypothetical protein